MLGILTSLDRRTKEGGNYLVSVSLNQYNQFLLAQGEYSEDVKKALREQHSTLSLRHYDDMTNLVGKTMRSLFKEVPHLFNPKHFWSKPSKFGKEQDEVLTFVGPAATFEKTQLGYDVGSCFLGAYEPKWP